MPGWRPPRSPKPARTRVKPAWWITAGALACYVMAYVAFSSWGQYVPATANSPPGITLAPAYEWAPGEFFDYSDNTWQRSHVAIFYPLLWLDHRFWHTANAAHSGRYPALALPAG